MNWLLIFFYAGIAAAFGAGLCIAYLLLREKSEFFKNRYFRELQYNQEQEKEIKQLNREREWMEFLNGEKV